MTEKRFKLYEHKDNDYILDNPHEHLDFIEMLGDALTSEEIVDLLNKLHEEIQKCKEYNGILYANHTKTDRGLVKQISELKKENEQLKSDNFNLNKSVEYLDEIVKEQCIKLDWASECGVKWDKEFKNWKGYE